MEPTTLTVSSPGRICLFGEHQDYLGLPVIAAAISLRITIHGRVRADNRMVLELPDIKSKVSFALGDQLPYSVERDYFRSCVNVLQKHGHRFSRGYDCVVRGNIPINAGTSSSSALVVTWIHFLSRISDDPVALSQEDIGKLAHEAEVLEFSEPGGMMDHYSTALGGLIFLESHPQIKIAALEARLGTFVLGNSEENKNTKGILARVKAEVSEAAAAARKFFPEFSFHHMTPDQLEELRNRLNKRQFDLLEATAVNRTITLEARTLLQERNVDHRKIGGLLHEHQNRLRDVLGISTPKIDSMIEAALGAGALGAKINGSGGGGCMFAYAPEHPERVAEAINAIGEAMVIMIDQGTRREPQED
jgi:galactokinase